MAQIWVATTVPKTAEPSGPVAASAIIPTTLITKIISKKATASRNVTISAPSSIVPIQLLNKVTELYKKAAKPRLFSDIPRMSPVFGYILAAAVVSGGIALVHRRLPAMKDHLPPGEHKKGWKEKIDWGYNFLKNAASHNAELQESIRQAHREVELARQNEQALRSEFVVLDDTIGSLTREIKDMDRAAGIYMEEITQFRKSLRREEGSVRYLRAEMERLEAENEPLMAQNKKLKGDLEKAQQHADELKTSLESQGAELTRAHTEINRLEGVRKRRHGDVEGLISDSDFNLRIIKKQQSEIKEQESELQDHEEFERDLENMIEEEKAKRISAENDLELLRSTLSRRDNARQSSGTDASPASSSGNSGRSTSSTKKRKRGQASDEPKASKRRAPSPERDEAIVVSTTHTTKKNRLRPARDMSLDFGNVPNLAPTPTQPTPPTRQRSTRNTPRPRSYNEISLRSASPPKQNLSPIVETPSRGQHAASAVPPSVPRTARTTSTRPPSVQHTTRTTSANPARSQSADASRATKSVKGRSGSAKH